MLSVGFVDARFLGSTTREYQIERCEDSPALCSTGCWVYEPQEGRLWAGSMPSGSLRAPSGACLVSDAALVATALGTRRRLRAVPGPTLSGSFCVRG